MVRCSLQVDRVVANAEAGDNLETVRRPEHAAGERIGRGQHGVDVPHQRDQFLFGCGALVRASDQLAAGVDQPALVVAWHAKEREAGEQDAIRSHTKTV